MARVSAGNFMGYLIDSSFALDGLKCRRVNLTLNEVYRCMLTPTADKTSFNRI